MVGEAIQTGGDLGRSRSSSTILATFSPDIPPIRCAVSATSKRPVFEQIPSTPPYLKGSHYVYQ